MPERVITNEDCMDLMARYDDNHFELAIVDPPYFSDVAKKTFPGSQITKYGVKRNRYESIHWEVPDENYFTELFRVSQEQIIWGCNYYSELIPHVSRIIWDKQNDTSTFSHAEIASKSMNIGVDIFRYQWNGFIQADMKHKESRIHPTQKPVALYKWLLQNYGKEGDNILDTHMGSGSIAIACHYMGFDITACELDTDYYNTAIQRIENETRQLEFSL